MDHNDIRKGILQAKHVDENSGLLFLEGSMKLSCFVGIHNSTS